MQTVAIIDYGMGNLHSAAKAIEHVGRNTRVVVTSDVAQIREADRVLFPGVGAIRDCMMEIRRLGLDSAVREAIAQSAQGMNAQVNLNAVRDQLHKPHNFSAAWRAVQYLENHDRQRLGNTNDREPRIAALAGIASG